MLLPFLMLKGKPLETICTLITKLIDHMPEDLRVQLSYLLDNRAMITLIILSVEAGDIIGTLAKNVAKKYKVVCLQGIRTLRKLLIKIFLSSIQ